MGLRQSICTLIICAAFLFATTAAKDTSEITTNGIQTNFGDLSFAGGMSYDPQHQTIYVTGQVGTQSCFVGVLKRIDGAGTRSSHLEFMSKQVFDEKTICQTIAFRKDVSRPGNALLLSLSEEGGLLTSQREKGSKRATQYGGVLDLQYSADGSSSEYSPDQSVLLYQTAPVTIPRSITNDPKRTNRVFVATMTSDATGIEYRSSLGSPHASNGLGLTVTPNLTPSGGLLKYGNNFAMTVEAIRLATEFSGPQPQWRKPFGVKRNSSNAKRTGVTVNQVLCSERNINDEKNKDASDLFVVGSALGSSPAFGQQELEHDDVHSLVAGFITKLNSNTGNLISSRRFVFDRKNNTPLSDTYIEAICEAPNDDDAIYVVGSYDGILTTGNKLRSLQVEETDLAVDDDILGGDDNVWTDDEPDDDALDEVQLLDGDKIDWTDDEPDDDARDEADLLGGVFEDDDDDDDDVDSNIQNADDDDDDDDDDDRFADDFVRVDDDFDDNDTGGIGEKEDKTKGEKVATPFVAKLRASTLETIWKQDFESTSDARAVACGIDFASNALYVAGIVEDGGELTGRTKSISGDDIFLMRLDSTDGSVSWAKQMGTSADDRLAYGGSGLVVLEEQKGVLLMGDTTGQLFSNSKKDSEIFIMEVNANGDVPKRTELTGVDYSVSASSLVLTNPANVASGGKVADDSNREAPSVSSAKPAEEKASASIGALFYMLLGAGVVIIAVGGTCFAISQKKHREATERALVFSYLQHFDLEDIDVKQAATGGWHGTYVGRLAQGVNVLEEIGNRDDCLVDIQRGKTGYHGTYVDTHGSAPQGSDFTHGSYSDEISDIKKSSSLERKLNNLSHSSVVRDILFMDYDESMYSDKGSKRNETTVRDPSSYSDEVTEEGNDPWGKEII